MSPDAAGLARAVVQVEGHVQGVGFRWWVWREAGRLGLSGHAINRWNGAVEVDAQGLPGDVDALVALLTAPKASGRPGRVTRYLIDRRSPDATITGFHTG